jgi:lipoprotein signal peptidase
MPIALGICIFIVLLNVMAGFVHGHFWEPVIELGVALGLASGSGWARRFAQGVAVLQMVIWFVLLILSWHLTTEEWAIALTMIGFDTVWLVTLSLPSVEAYFAPVGRTR